MDVVPIIDQSMTQRIAAHATPVVFSPNHRAAKRFWEFFAGISSNANTRQAYKRACFRFGDWCEAHQLPLECIEPLHVLRYTTEFEQTHAKATVKQHMSALKKLFDHLITGQVLASNPVDAVSRPKEIIDRGKTRQLEAAQMKQLFQSIELNSIIDYRDRAMIGIMAYSFARVSSVCAMNVDSYYTNGKRSYFVLLTKGDKVREIPAHHKAQEYLDSYLEHCSDDLSKHTALFRTISPKTKALTETRMNRNTTWRMVKRRCAAAELPDYFTNHSFRGTGITNYMSNGGSLETAAKIAGHANPSTTKFYDHSSDHVDLDEIERILF